MSSTHAVTAAAEAAPGGLVGPHLCFDLAAEAEALRRSPHWRLRGHTARTLTMHPDLRLVLVLLQAGRQLHQHRTAHRLTVQTLAGHVQLTLPDRSVDLRAGSVLVLDRAVPHEVIAVDDSAFLLSLGGAPAPRDTGPDDFDLLAHEHRRFAALLDFVEAQVALFRRGERPDYELLQDVFFYLTSYPDRFHHPREDRVFATIAERAPAARAHVEELARQHRQIAECGAQFRACLEAVLGGAILPLEAIERPARDYVALYRRHMALEERTVFPLGRVHVRAEEWAHINAAMKPEDDPLFGELVDERYRALLRQITRAAECDS